MAMNGYDISNYQSKLSIAQVPCDFVIIKATQGITYYSPSFEKQNTEAFKCNKLVGVYHYVGANDYKAEVDFFLSKVSKYLGNVLLCIDWEGAMNPKFGDNNYITNLMDYLYKKTNIKPIIYTSKSVCRASYWTTVPLNYDLWLAQYGSNNEQKGYNPKPWTDGKGNGKFKDPIIFQYSSKGKLPGYNGYLDLDICYLDKDSWLEKCKPEKTDNKAYNNARSIDKPITVNKSYIVTADTLNIRENPDTSSKDIGDLKNGSIVTVDKIENGFAHFEGWCSTKYLK